MLQHCNPLEKSKTWFGSVYFNLCKFVLTFFYTAVLLSLARGFPSVSWVPRDAHERIVIGLLECFADSKSSLLDTLAKWFKLWICKLDSPHLLAILASFYLRQSNQSRYSRSWSRKMLTSLVKSIWLYMCWVSDLSFICNQSRRKLQTWWSWYECEKKSNLILRGCMT